MKNHSSKSIIGHSSSDLKGKKVILCITGSVAAIRSPEIARELMRHGAEVFTVMSEMSQKIIHPYLMEWATGNPVVTKLTGKIEHVTLTGEHSRKADLVLFAPVTANTISKIACGIDDTPVTTVASTAFGSKIPILMIPAMHGSMYHHPIIQENIRKLKSLGVDFVGPQFIGATAKIAETSEIVSTLRDKFAIKKNLTGKKILVTAGPTLTYIDPIRVITNKSSGKMGIAIVEEAHERGAQITLISGSKSIRLLSGVKTLYVETTEEMHQTVVSELTSNQYDIVIATAAVSDWSAEHKMDHKVSTQKVPKLTINLKATPKIIDMIKQISPTTFLVSFKAEYNVFNEELISKAYKKLKESHSNLIVANDVGRKGTEFGSDTNELFIIDESRKIIHVPLCKKRQAASRLLDVVVKKLKYTTKKKAT